MDSIFGKGNNFKINGINFKKDKVLAFSSFILVISMIFYNSKEKRSKLMELLQNRFFVVSVLFAMSFSIYTLYFVPKDDDSEKVKKATKQAILGFLIGMFHHLDFNVGPFWFIWLASYYLGIGE